MKNKTKYKTVKTNAMFGEFQAKIDSTGFKGGDSGHGGCLCITMGQDNNNPGLDFTFDTPNGGLILILRGDAEMEFFPVFLRKIADNIEKVNGESIYKLVKKK